MPEVVLSPTEIDELRRAFPAKFSKAVIEQIQTELAARMLHEAVILDPFGGVGGVHDLAFTMPVTTWAVDIEPEQAACHPRTVLGDSRYLVRVLAEHPEIPKPQVIVTSPAYGNRLADQYLGSDDEKCRGKGKLGCKDGWALNEDGDFVVVTIVSRDPSARLAPDSFKQKCERCHGTGKAKSTRQGYAIALGRKLSPGSGAALAWGGEYRNLHSNVLDSMLGTGAEWWLINVSSFLKTIQGNNRPQYQQVMEWWVEQVAARARIVGLRAIETPRMGNGENGKSRVPVEHLIIARAA